MEEKKVISGKQVKDMLLGAYRSFEKNFEQINDLNVFPVPDGDTGSNMMHTMASVAKAVSALEDEVTASEVGSVAARSAIMGARGNSGVILSQLLRGIGKGMAGKRVLTNIELGKCFQFGVLYAYRSVSKPVEGTILSVARGMAKATYDAIRSKDDLEDILQDAIQNGKVELAQTPDKLPVLKEAGVVDAGGQGLICFFEGCLAGLRGQDCEKLEVVAKAAVKPSNVEKLDLEFPYCTEFIVKEASVTKEEVSEALTIFGNSMIVAVMDDIVKVHIHTKHPGDALNRAQQWGSLHDIKINNMVDEHEERLFKTEAAPQPVKKSGLGIVTVAAGDGIAEMMHKLGAAEIISGGQSMNPPVEDFVSAIENGSCEQYIILPNNKNIILAAEQVKKLLGNNNVAYVPTTNLAQGMAALLHFDATKSLEENVAIMTAEAKEVTSGAITVAVRDSRVNDMEVKKDEYLGLLNDKIVCHGTDLQEVLKGVIAVGEYELITMYYGSDMTAEGAEEISEFIEELDEDVEVEIFKGGQPLYPLLLSME